MSDKNPLMATDSNGQDVLWLGHGFSSGLRIYAETIMKTPSCIETIRASIGDDIFAIDIGNALYTHHFNVLAWNKNDPTPLMPSSLYYCGQIDVDKLSSGKPNWFIFGRREIWQGAIS